MRYKFFNALVCLNKTDYTIVEYRYESRAFMVINWLDVHLFVFTAVLSSFLSVLLLELAIQNKRVLIGKCQRLCFGLGVILLSVSYSLEVRMT